MATKRVKISDKMLQAIKTLARTNVQRMPKQAQADYIISLSRTFDMTPNEFLQVLKPAIARNRAKSGQAYIESYPELMLYQSALFNARQAYRAMLKIRNSKGTVKAKPVAKPAPAPVAKPAPVSKPAPAPVAQPTPVAKSQDWQGAWLALGKLVFSHLG
jgi:hypothetical protein